MPATRNSEIIKHEAIPTEWSIKRLKYCATEISKGAGITKEEVIEDGNTQCVRYGEIYSKYNNSFSDCYSATNKEKLTSLRFFAYGDILFAGTGELIEEIGKNIVYLGDKHCLAGGDIIVVKHEQNPSFLNYALNSAYSQAQKSCGKLKLKVVHISPTEIGNIDIALPNLSEQERIATFLDTKCAEIDALSADIQAQIDTLEEYKRSVITEAVTKGLNKDAEMQDSGIPFIGSIPKHWEIHPLYCYFGERKAQNYALKEQNLLSLSYGRIIRKDINTNGGLLPASFNTYNIVEKNDIIIRPTDLQNDKRSLRTGLVGEHGIITSAYIALKPKQGVNSRYYHYLLHSYDVMKVFYNMGNGVRQGLNYSEFAKLMVFAPPTQEQEQIADYLDSKVADINAIIDIKHEQLATLDEYKKSLIYEYVTGKKSVSEVS